MTGPTEEGSIVAHVKADLAQFDAAMDVADERVRKTSATRAEVTVNASVDEAMAKLDAVDREVNKLGDDNIKASAKTVAARAAVEQATKRESIALDSLKLAHQRLQDAQMRGVATETQLMALRLSAARAENIQEQATLKLAAANELLRKSQQNDANPPAPPTPVATSSAGGSSYGVGLAVGVGALVAGLAPLAGYITAVSGALAGMGAAGVFAIVGIKNAMEDGTAEGNLYAAGMQGLKGDLDELGRTAAGGLLVPFQKAISSIDEAMPSLNNEIGLFAQLLGNTGDVIVQTLVSGFQVLMPLFIQAGVYVEQLAVGWQKWTQSGGLLTFAEKAAADLPKVADALGSLLTGAISVIGGLDPLGRVLLDIVNVVGVLLQGLGWLLDSGFGPLTLGVAAAVGAFMLFTKVGPVVELVSKAVTALGLSVETAMGPIGIIAAVIGGVGIALATAATSADAATSSMNNYTSAVQQDNGVIGDNVRLQAAKNLQDTDAYSNAQKLGVALETVTAAGLGNASATKSVTATQAEATKAYNDLIAKGRAWVDSHHEQVQAALQTMISSEELTDSTKGQASAVKDAIKAYNEIQTAIGGTTISTKKQLDAQVALAARYGDTLPQYLAAQAANKATADQMDAATRAMVQQNDAAGLLKNALDQLNDKTLNLAQAQTGMAGSNNSVLDSFQQNGKAIDGNSKAAVANQQAIQQSVLAAQQYAEAVGKSTGSTDQARQALADSKDQLEKTLKAQGDLTGGVQAYIDKIFQIPTVAETKVDIDTAVATLKLQQLAKQIVDLSNSYLSVTARMPGSIAVTKAEGGTIGGFAGGGSWGTVMGGGSTTSDSILTRLSRDEEVIKASSASQVRPVLKAFNRDPQGTLNGLMSAGAAISSSPVTVNVVNKAGVALDDLIELHIERSGRTQKVALSTGKQKAAI